MSEIKVISNCDDPILSIVIPTRDAERNGLLTSLIDSLKLQTLSDWELILVIGDKRQGRAINSGVGRAKANIIATMDDDTILGDNNTLKQCYEELLSDPKIGMIGAACEIPANASPFQRRAMLQIPRRYFPRQSETVDSDMVQHPLLMMKKEVFWEIGGEDEELIRGLDPLLRFKTRQAGYRVCIARDAFIYHDLPDSLAKVVIMYFRNGRGSAFARKFFPDRIYELGNGFERNEFRARRHFSYRVGRKFTHLFRHLLKLEFIAMIVQVSYVCGYLTELVMLTFRRNRNVVSH